MKLSIVSGSALVLLAANVMASDDKGRDPRGPAARSVAQSVSNCRGVDTYDFAHSDAELALAMQRSFDELDRSQMNPIDTFKSEGLRYMDEHVSAAEILLEAYCHALLGVILPDRLTRQEVSEELGQYVQAIAVTRFANRAIAGGMPTDPRDLVRRDLCLRIKTLHLGVLRVGLKWPDGNALPPKIPVTSAPRNALPSHQINADNDAELAYAVQLSLQDHKKSKANAIDNYPPEGLRDLIQRIKSAIDCLYVLKDKSELNCEKIEASRRILAVRLEEMAKISFVQSARLGLMPTDAVDENYGVRMAQCKLVQLIDSEVKGLGIVWPDAKVVLTKENTLLTQDQMGSLPVVQYLSVVPVVNPFKNTIERVRCPNAIKK